MATKGMTVMQQGTEEFTINDPNIADEFSTSVNYAIGDLCYYQGTLYRFKAAHTAGAWNASHAEAKNLKQIIDATAAEFDLKAQTLDNKIKRVDSDLYSGNQEEQIIGRTWTKINNTSYIWFKVWDRSPCHIDTVEFMAYEGTTYFYKITWDGESTASHELVKTVVNTSSEEGKMKSVSLVLDLKENEYIGINGFFGAANDSQVAVKDRTMSLSTQAVGDAQDQSLAFNVYQYGAEEIVKSVKELKRNLYGKVKMEDLSSDGWTYTTNTTYVFFQYPKYRYDHIDRIEFIALEGTVRFYVVTYYPEDGRTGSFKKIAEVTNSLAETGTIKTISVGNIYLSEYQYIGINGAFAAKIDSAVTPGHYDRTLLIQVGDLDAGGGVVQNIATQNLGFNAYLSTAIELDAESLGTRIDEIQADYTRKIAVIDEEINQQEHRDADIILYDALLDANNTDISGTKSMGAFGQTIDATKKLKKLYCVADKTVRFLCKFESTTVAEFGTDISLDTAYKWTWFTVNVGSGVITAYGASGQSFTFSCTILNSTDRFLVEMSKFYNVFSIDITNLTSGITQHFEHVNNGTGGTGSGAVGSLSTVNSQCGYYYLGLSSGSAYQCKKVTVVSAPCDLIAYGDSITETEAYFPADYMDQAWTMLVRKHMHGRFLSSGYSASQISHITARIQNELPFIKPKYCMITIGTNQGDTVENLTALVQYIKSQDVTPILNHIPCYKRTDSDTDGFIAINAIIDQVRTAENVKGADFDVCTSVGYDGETLDTSCFWDDGEYIQHPNVKGSKKMFRQLLIDVPEIFQ